MVDHFTIVLKAWLGSVDKSSFEALPPAACPRDQDILLNAQHCCSEIYRYGFPEPVAGRRDLNCQHTLVQRFANQQFSN